MTLEEIQELWGDDLYDVFAEHIDNEGWLTSDWSAIIEDEVPKFDKHYNDNPLHGETYQRMYFIDFEENEDETKCRPLPNQFF